MDLRPATGTHELVLPAAVGTGASPPKPLTPAPAFEAALPMPARSLDRRPLACRSVPILPVAECEYLGAGTQTNAEHCVATATVPVSAATAASFVLEGMVNFSFEDWLAKNDA